MQIKSGKCLKFRLGVVFLANRRADNWSNMAEWIKICWDQCGHCFVHKLKCYLFFKARCHQWNKCIAEQWFMMLIQLIYIHRFLLLSGPVFQTLSKRRRFDKWQSSQKESQMKDLKFLHCTETRCATEHFCCRNNGSNFRSQQ